LPPRAGPAQRRRFAADLMASQSPCEAVKSFDVDTCAAVCDCVQDLAKAGRSRAALCNTYCNKCAVKARTCDAKPLSGICLKIVTNNMVKQCVAEVAGFGASRE
jgi:hypothetical protein